MDSAYTIAQVLRAERPAWSGGFYYDGVDFYRFADGEPRGAAVEQSEVPARGWRHKAGCRCPLCAAPT